MLLHCAHRSHAVALVEDLVEAGYLESTGEQTFLDGYSLYRPCRALSPQEYSSPSTPSDENGRISQEAQEPLWVKQIPLQDSAPTTGTSITIYLVSAMFQKAICSHCQLLRS